jgi:NAD(P)-dependent dehydrogenase (short-subunit alcohol dehydrogenase family)
MFPAEEDVYNGRCKMRGATCLVTGSSGGIGFETALALARKGAHVVLVGHNRQRGEAALERIRAADKQASVEFMLADLSVQEQIRTLAKGVREQLDRLDVLVNNAGGFFLQRRESADGIEMTWALDYLNYFLLTNLLLDFLQASAPARVVNVSSGIHRRAEIYFDDPGLEKGYSGWKAYGQAKLADLMFTYELARRLEGSGVTANALHPGSVATNIGQQHPLVRLAMRFVHAFGAKSPREGAGTSIYLASSPDVEGVSGKYFVDKKPVRSSRASYDEQVARRLWTISAEMTGL